MVEIRFVGRIKKQGHSFYIRVPAGLAKSIDIQKEYSVQLSEVPAPDVLDPLFKKGDEV